MIYFSSVNRGLALTTPGKLTTLLILALGTIAIASALNALFLMVSFLIGLILVSGILSERVVKNISVRSVGSVRAPANENLLLNLIVETGDQFPGLAGMELELYQSSGRLLGRASQKFLLPSRAERWSLPIVPLSRGWYRELRVMVRTQFPFGVLQKFRWVTLPTDIVIFPELKADFEARLRRDLHLYDLRAEAKDSFWGHRSYQNRDPVRFIDWRKSAGRSISSWVSREFIGENLSRDFSVNPAWEWIRQHAKAEDYEGHLSMIATVLALLARTGQSVELVLSDGTVESDLDRAMVLIASLAPFSPQKNYVFPRQGQSSRPGTLSVNMQDYLKVAR